MKTPSTNGGNGRDATGRFTKGNPGGPGNPFARRVALMRQTMLEAVSDEDLREIVRALVDRAKQGENDSVQILFDRLFGKPTAAPGSRSCGTRRIASSQTGTPSTPNQDGAAVG